METHFTAWLTTQSDIILGDYCEVDIFKDVSTGLDKNGNHTWVCTGGSVFNAITNIRHDNDTDEGATENAETILSNVGWETVGPWEIVDTGYIATVKAL